MKTGTAAPTLTDRYVWAVTHHLPADQQADVARELRATIEDTVEGRVGAGAVPAEAERAVLAEMGRPERLAAGYGGSSLWLIGPALYPDYVRLLRVLAPVMLAVLGAVWVLGLVVDGVDSVGEAVVDGLALVWNASVQLLFWVTLVFVVVERTRPETEREKPLVEWTPEHLPDIPPGRQIGRVESAFGLVFLGLLLLFVLDNLAGVSFGTDFVQVLDAGMAPGWKVALVAVLLASLAVELVKLVTGRWTWPLAVANAAVDLAFLGVVGVLWVGEDLLDPGLGESLGQITDAVGMTSGIGWWDMTVAVVLAVVVVVTLWDMAEGFAKLRRSHRDG